VIVVQAERFRRLLRWYPRAWRVRNGAALLGTVAVTETAGACRSVAGRAVVCRRLRARHQTVDVWRSAPLSRRWPSRWPAVRLWSGRSMPWRLSVKQGVLRERQSARRHRSGGHSPGRKGNPVSRGRSQRNRPKGTLELHVRCSTG